MYVAHQYEFILFFLYFVILSSAAPPYIVTDYCDFVCQEPPYKHVICQYNQNCRAVPGVTDLGGTVKLREDIIMAINTLRNKVASGTKELKYRNQGAKNMHSVSYDLELEYLMQCFLNKQASNNHVGDHCAASKRFGCIQNWNFYTPNFDPFITNVSSMVEYVVTHSEIRHSSWIKKFPLKRHINKTLTEKWSYFYAVIVFANVKYVGCGKSNYDGRWRIGCNYASDKCLDKGLTVYNMANSASEIASECEIKSKKFKSLCGEVERIPNDEPWKNSTVWSASDYYYGGFGSQGKRIQPNNYVVVNLFISISILFICII